MVMCKALGVKKQDLEFAVSALGSGTLTPEDLRQWRFDNALGELIPSEFATLIDALLAHGAAEALPVALDLIGAYCHSASDKLGSLRPQVRKCVSRCARSGEWPADSWNLEQFVEWMLDRGRQDADACAVALDLAGIMVESSPAAAGELPDSVVRQLLSDFSEVVWSRVIGAAIVADHDSASALAYRLGMDPHGDKRLIMSLPVDVLFSWCHAHPDVAPAFAAHVLPVLAKKGDEAELHPTLRRLVDEFGECEGVLSSIESNIDTYSWVGSMTGYYPQFVAPLSALARHRIPAVRDWAAYMVGKLRESTGRAHDRDAELEAKWKIRASR